MRLEEFAHAMICVLVRSSVLNVQQDQEQHTFAAERLTETAATPAPREGTRREVTLLLSDIVNFAEITERVDPLGAVENISRYFAAMSHEIAAHSGVVEKFVGDTIMAAWNAAADDPDHAANACAGALALQRAGDRLNAAFAREGWPPYRTRCGLHTGGAVVGNTAEHFMDDAAPGATVKLAARIKSLNRNYGTAILVSSALRARAESRFVFRSVDRVSPKGRAEAFEIHELRGERGSVDVAETELCQDWEPVYAALRNGPIVVAEQELSAFLAKYPQDGVALYHRGHRT
jgi:adenylate cyclase